MDTVKAHLHSAIQIGAPTYNEGRYEDCFRIYKNAAEAAMSASGGSHAGIVSRLQAAVMDASRQEDPSQRAWTMRRAMDDVLIMPAPMQPMPMPMPVSASGTSQRAITRIGYGPARDTYQDMNDRARERIRQRPAPRADWNMPSTTLPVHRPQTSSSLLPPAYGSPTRDAMPLPTTTRDAKPLPTTPPPRTATASERRAGAVADGASCWAGDDASPMKLLGMRERGMWSAVPSTFGERGMRSAVPGTFGERGMRSAVPSTFGESYGHLARQRFDRPSAPSWAPSEPESVGGDGCWGPAATHDGVRTSHSGAFQSGGPATNKHFSNSLCSGSLVFNGTIDKFVTSNDAFYGGNARIGPSPPPPRSDPNFRLVNGDREPGRELPVAMTWGADTYRRGSSSRVASICR